MLFSLQQEKETMEVRTLYLNETGFHPVLLEKKNKFYHCLYSDGSLRKIPVKTIEGLKPWAFAEVTYKDKPYPVSRFVRLLKQRIKDGYADPLTKGARRFITGGA